MKRTVKTIKILVFLLIALFVGSWKLFAQESNAHDFLRKIKFALIENTSDTIIKYASDKIRSDSLIVKKDVEWIHNYIKKSGFTEKHIGYFDYYFESNKPQFMIMDNTFGFRYYEYHCIFRCPYFFLTNSFRIGHSLDFIFEREENNWVITKFYFTDNYANISSFIKDFFDQESKKDEIEYRVFSKRAEIHKTKNITNNEPLEIITEFQNIRYKKLTEANIKMDNTELHVVRLQKTYKSDKKSIASDILGEIDTTMNLVVAFYTNSNEILISDNDKYAFYEIDKEVLLKLKNIIENVFIFENE